MENILGYFAYKYEGDYKKIYDAIKSKEKVEQKDYYAIRDDLECNFVTIISKNYPEKLKSMINPPFVLFYIGDLSLANQKSVGVIGSRDSSKYGRSVCEEMVMGLVNEDYVIVSGLAKGIDGVAHSSALKVNGKTIAVIGNGVNEYYPKENKEIQDIIKEKGLLISEYPPFSKPKKENFPFRNRIIAALSDSLLVVEAKSKSGTMITVSEALNLGKDIMCVPSNVNVDSGTNKLIKNGAYLVERVSDVLEIIK